MKIRNGFVSNSSSSSFVCLITGEVEGGYDLSISEAGMCSCIYGHVFCERFRLAKPPPVDDDIEDDDIEDDDDEDSYDIPVNQCPICTLKNITDGDLLKYAIKKNNWDKKLMENSLRAEFANYKEFLEGMKK